MNSHWADAVRTAMKEQKLLTDRELQVLRLRRAGMSRAEMAQHLHVAPETIKTYVSFINNKLDGRST
jgi:DNA-binding NarL/FixJ family response regulator